MKRFKVFKCRVAGCPFMPGHWVLSDNESESVHTSWQAAVDRMNWRIENPDKDIIWI